MLKKISHWFLGKVSIRSKLVISFTVLVLIPLIILSIFTFQQSKKNMYYQVANTMDSNLSSLSNEINWRFEKESDYIKYLAYNLKFRKILEAEPVDRVKLALELNNSVEPILWYYIASSNYVKSINIYTPNIDTGLGSFLKPLSELVDENWYAQYGQERKNIWVYVNDKLYVTRSILDVSTVSETIAIMQINYFPNSFFEPLNSMNYLSNGIIVVDSHNNLLYQKKTQNEIIDTDILNAITIDDNKFNGNGSSYILQSSTLPETNWTIYYYINTQMIINELSQIYSLTGLLVFLILIIAIIVIALLSKTLSRRILLLRDCAEEVAKGDLERAITTNDTDEIGIVINSFGIMTKKLNETIIQVQKIQIEKKGSELKALQAMINPHFLYNSLSAIKWKSIRSNNNDIGEIAGLLATFYRTSLNNGDKLTTVENELENIRVYIELQRHMHEFPFTVKYTIDENALHCLILNFLLQPLVENAIKHGIDYTDETQDGCLIIECVTEDEYIIFNIMNNGPHINEEKIADSLNSPNKGYGLYNIRERLNLFYGNDSELTGFINDDDFTCFRIRVKSLTAANTQNRSTDK